MERRVALSTARALIRRIKKTLIEPLETWTFQAIADERDSNERFVRQGPSSAQP